MAFDTLTNPASPRSALVRSVATSLTVAVALLLTTLHPKSRRWRRPTWHNCALALITSAVTQGIAVGMRMAGGPSLGGRLLLSI